MHEHETITQLYQHQASSSEGKLDNMDMNIGSIRATMKRWGMTVDFTTTVPAEHDGALVAYYLNLPVTPISVPQAQSSTVLRASCSQFGSTDLNTPTRVTLTHNMLNFSNSMCTCHSVLPLYVSSYASNLWQKSGSCTCQNQYEFNAWACEIQSILFYCNAYST